jgi:hypothetical protein
MYVRLLEEFAPSPSRVSRSFPAPTRHDLLFCQSMASSVYVCVCVCLSLSLCVCACAATRRQIETIKGRAAMRVNSTRHHHILFEEIVGRSLFLCHSSPLHSPPPPSPSSFFCHAPGLPAAFHMERASADYATHLTAGNEKYGRYWPDKTM